MRVDGLFSLTGTDTFHVGELLGQGGMSQVRRATVGDGRLVAVKYPRPECPDSDTACALIRREFEYLDRISHPNVVTVHGLVRIPGEFRKSEYVPGIVMEYLGGGDLVSLAGGPPRCWVPAGAQVVRAIDHLHRAGIVHGDIKPRNILMRSGDVPCLIDFALAARVGGLAPRSGGTAAYQYRARTGEGDVIDDVYALAVLVYELWIGALPFGRNPELRAPADWHGFPEFGPCPGVRGLGRLARVLSDVLSQRPEVLCDGVGPLRHALESVVVEH